MVAHQRIAFLSRLVFFALTALMLQSCIAAIPLIVSSVGDDQTATVTIPRSADIVYATAVDIANRRPGVVIVKQEEEERLLQVERDERSATVKATPISDSQSQLFINADSGEGDEKDRELALFVAQLICDELGVNYTLVGE